MPRFEVQGAALLALHFNPEDGPTRAALRGANVLEHEVRAYGAHA